MSDQPTSGQPSSDEPLKTINLGREGAPPVPPTTALGPGATGQQPYAQQPYGQQPYAQQPYGQQPFVQSPYAGQHYGPGAPIYQMPHARGSLASVLRRLGAIILDGLLVGIVYVVVAYLATQSFFGMSIDFTTGRISLDRTDMIIWVVLSNVLGLAYYLGFYSTTGQPLGKKMLGIRVVRKDGQPLDLATAVKRMGITIGSAIYGLLIAYFFLDPTIFTNPNFLTNPAAVQQFQQQMSTYNALGNVSTLVVLIDYLWALRGTDRQTLHDVMAGTVVVHD